MIDDELDAHFRYLRECAPRYLALLRERIRLCYAQHSVGERRNQIGRDLVFWGASNGLERCGFTKERIAREIEEFSETLESTNRAGESAPDGA